VLIMKTVLVGALVGAVIGALIGPTVFSWFITVYVFQEGEYRILGSLRISLKSATCSG